MEAINKKHQALVNRTLKALKIYNQVNDLRDDQENNTEFEEIYEDREWRRLNTMCESRWDRFENYLAQLPKREQQQILKSDLY